MRDAWLLTPGRVPYGRAYAAMRALAARRARGEVPDTLILLEHPPVYTAGRRTDPAHILLTETEIRGAGAELHPVDRGGSVTFHGPGQLVAYPVVHLGTRPALAEHVRRMQQVVIRACSDLGIGVAEADEVGVWAGERKICAIGVKSSRRVTYHGFALNCSTDLSWFDAIVACGLADRGVTTLSELTGRDVRVEDVIPVVAARFAEVFRRRLVPAPPGVREAFTSGRALASAS